jgi:hypothetical protein
MPTGRALAGMSSVFAEFEAICCASGSKRVLRKRGVGSAIERSPTVAHHAETMRHLAATGLSISAIARQLGSSRASVRRFLARRAVGGIPVQWAIGQLKGGCEQPMAENVRLRCAERTPYHTISGSCPWNSQVYAESTTAMIKESYQKALAR